jgi:hypothetical protein
MAPHPVNHQRGAVALRIISDAIRTKLGGVECHDWTKKQAVAGAMPINGYRESRRSVSVMFLHFIPLSAGREINQELGITNYFNIYFTH